MKLKGKLVGKIAEGGLSVKDIADQMGLDTSTLRRKMEDVDRFKLGEIKQIAHILHLTQKGILDIFFE